MTGNHESHESHEWWMSVAGRYDAGPKRKRGSEHLPSLALRASDPCGGQTVSDRAELKLGKEVRTFRKIMQINARTWNRRRQWASRCGNCTYVAGDAPPSSFRTARRPRLDERRQEVEIKRLMHRRERPDKSRLLEKNYVPMHKMFRRKGGGRDTTNQQASLEPERLKQISPGQRPGNRRPNTVYEP